MRAAVLNGARVVLLAGPTALAFFSGGYFDGPRAWAGLLAWLLVAVAVIAAPRPAMTPGSWLAVGGLAAFAGVDAAVDHLGAGRGQRVSRRPDRDPLHRGAARRRCCCCGQSAPSAWSSPRSLPAC